MIHAVYDLTGCADPLAADLLDAMRATAGLLGCTILGELPVQFQPHGVTCVLVLGESHLTVSTWPEFGLAHIDLFTCRADATPTMPSSPSPAPSVPGPSTPNASPASAHPRHAPPSNAVRNLKWLRPKREVPKRLPG